jgi:DNA adenine methylase
MESNRNLRSITATRPAAAYVGGKRNLAKRLVAMIEAVPHKAYAEPFVGMGGVFFRREVIPTLEVINDYSGDVSCFFRILQRHYPQFMETLKFQITSRDAFDRLLKVDPETLTDLERAARFLYVQRLAFGGKVVSRTFGVATERAGRFNINTLAPRLADLHERLAGVVIERLDFETFIKTYDRKTTLFYLDPPYHGSEKFYGEELFTRADFVRLAAVLATLKGRFILSINDTPEVRTIFKAFKQEKVKTTYSLSGNGKPSPASELIISN